MRIFGARILALTATVAMVVAIIPSGPLGCADGIAAAADAARTATTLPDAGVSSDGGANTDGGANPDGSGSPDAPAPVGLAGKYPCDVGIDSAPDLVFHESFEEGAVSSVTSRYDAFKNASGMTLVTDVPSKSCGKASMRLVAGGAESATDLYKVLAGGYDELYVRWYAKYDKAIPWHHTGVWFGGYNPATPYPNPQAGLKPNGDDRFSVAIEPVFDLSGPSPRLDTYVYWMQMHSWMAQPSGNQAYYGHTLVHQNGFTLDEQRWLCLEAHVKLNTALGSATGAMLEVWKNDALVVSFTETSPKGYWIKDKFCPPGADGNECTHYPAPADTTLNLQQRSTSALKLNAFWPQNYITAPATGGVQYDDMVVAKSRVGCLR